MGSLSTLPRAEDLTAPPVVGQRYLVPTVRYEWHGYVSDWPVMGPRHEDHDLRFFAPHYHLDLRFLKGRQAQKLRRAYGFQGHKEGHEAVALAAASGPLHVLYVGAEMPAPVLRPRLCVEPDHRYPTERAARNGPHVDMWRTYAGRRCGRNADGGLICPHKGFSLGSLQPDEHGRVVCPLHGLMIDVRAGVVIGADEMPEVRA